ncbi:hypothetical protein O181_004906 [Austropuccinia psidii MF-1]|uniref:Uncharacterized protein n=1 Tax=Austropuccinia psidii MF-1 TaxID=1389203 RepID=A0A9Q3GFG2_9BASI|nr:hypothetical protein [Austropuccinia psidii MF-1]
MLKSVDIFSTSSSSIFNGAYSSSEYLDQDSIEAFNSNMENNLNSSKSPFNIPVAFTPSPDIKLASPPLFLPSLPTFSLNHELKSLPSPGRIIEEEPILDKIDESHLVSLNDQPELAPSESNKACC